MNDRQRTIATAYEHFRRVRRLPADSLVVEVVGMVLQETGQSGLTPDEARYSAACGDCGWATPYEMEQTRQIQAGANELERLPDAGARRSFARRPAPDAGAAVQPAQENGPNT